MKRCSLADNSKTGQNGPVMEWHSITRPFHFWTRNRPIEYQISLVFMVTLFFLAGNDELAYLSTTPNEVCDDARKKEDEEDSKLGFKIVRITHCKNPSTIYIRSLKLVR
jgi:hypothetical protein